MRTLDPAGFASREPTARKIQRGTLVAVGPHDEWSCDGHNKLVKYGFPIWGVRDNWGGKWLGLWVIPNNRYKDVIAYLWLSLIKDLGSRLPCLLINLVSVDTQIQPRYAGTDNN
jgi:hypothetical protein